MKQLDNLSPKQREALKTLSGIDPILQSMGYHPEIPLSKESYLEIAYPDKTLTPETVLDLDPSFEFPAELTDEAAASALLDRLDDHASGSGDTIENLMRVHDLSREEAREVAKDFGG